MIMTLIVTSLGPGHILEKNLFYRFLVKYIAFFLGCFICFSLHSKIGINVVVAASLVGMAGTFIPAPPKIDPKAFAGAIYCGSFAGMCSSGVLQSFSQILLLSTFGSLFYLFTPNLFKGFGGKLGTIAFISVALVYLLRGIM